MNRIVSLLFSPTVWLVQFVVVYSTESLMCSRLGASVGHQILVLVTSAVALLVVILRMKSDLIAAGGSAWFPVHFLTAIAVVWTALPAIILPSCSPLVSA